MPFDGVDALAVLGFFFVIVHTQESINRDGRWVPIVFLLLELGCIEESFRLVSIDRRVWIQCIQEPIVERSNLGLCFLGCCNSSEQCFHLFVIELGKL